MENNIKKFNEYITENLNVSLNENSDNVFDFITSLGFDITNDNLSKESIQDILIDVSDKVDDDKYHWIETELLKLIK